MFKQNKLQIFSYRKVKGYGLASAVIASMFLAQGIVSADVVTSPDSTKTTLSNDKASVTVDANHFKDSNDKSAKELYDAKEYEADKVTTGKDTVTDESKTVVSYETENGTKLKEDVTKTATEEKELNYKIEGPSGKEYTGTSTPTSNVNADLEKQDTIQKDGEKYKYVRTETTQGNETVLTDTHFNDVETKASVEGMYNNDGSIKYDKIKDGSRVWVLEEKEDGTYGNYALIENAQGLSDEKIQEAAKTATTKFSKAEVEKLGGIKDTDSIVVYETNIYAARKQTSEHFGRDFYYLNTANESLFRKTTIDKIFEAGLEGLEKRDNSYFYKGVELPTIENFKTIPSINDNKLYGYDEDTNNKYYTNEPAGYTVPTTYYNVINDFFIKNPESEIFRNKANDVFWGASSGDLVENTEEVYPRLAFVTDILNKSLKDKYNIDTDTQDFKNKTLESKSNNNRPVFEKKYSFKKTDLHDHVKSWEETNDSLLDKELWVRELSTSYSVENVRKVRNLIKAYQNLYGEPTSDVFNNKNDSDVTVNEYAEAIYNKITSHYIETFKDLFTEDGAKAIKNKFGNSPILRIGNKVEHSLDSSQKDMTIQAGSELYRNSPGIITENTESFTYHEVITPLRAYRLTADNNTVRHIYEQVKRGSVIATHKDTEGNELLPQESIKTNEYDGEAYTTSSKEIPNKVVTDTTPEGFTRTTITTYKLVENPSNKDGNVIGGETITVPYVYRPLNDVRINGSVIATYSTEDGEKLTDDIAVKTDAPEQEDYDTSAKEFASKTETSDVNGLTKTTITRYELIGTPANKRGFVVGNQTITVPYVYRKVVTESINGSVIATYKDTEGNVLAPQESVKTNVPDKEAYTTNPKVIPDVVTTDTDANGFTRKTTKVYTLVETPNNQNGSVVGGTVTTVPYVYNVKTIVETNGSVIATHKDTEGNELAPQENVKTNEPSGSPYTTNSKEIPDKVETDKTPDGLTRVTTTHYELVENPSNKDGNVIGGETVTVPYVYKPVKSVQVNGSVIATYTTEDGEKLADDVAVKTDVPSSEAYTTERKTFDSVTKEDKVNGFTRVTTTRYELIETPTNADGQVEANKVITVPYVYRKVVTETIKGSVIATYKDEEGTILASEEKVITNQNAGTYYAAAAKTIQASASSKVTENGREVTLITYELIKTPDNETGEVVGGETLVVPYVYRKVVTNKLVPNNPPVVEDETLKVTRFHSDTGEELQPDVAGFEDAPKTIGSYQFTGKTEMNDGNDVQTHIYTKIVTEIPNEAPKVDVPEAKVTRFHSDTGEELQPDVAGFEDAPKTIGDYKFTGKTEMNDGNDVQTHIYTKIVTKIPNEAPKVEKDELKLTRFMLEDRKTEIKDMVEGFVKPIEKIGDYTYTGVTDSDEGGAVITHIYKLVETEVPNVSELPKDSPVHDKPEFNGGVVPNDPPVHDKPEFNGGVVPNDPPVHDKPEYNGGVVPNDSPVHDKPKLDIPTPEVPTPTPELPKPETPSVETPKPSQPLEQKPQEKYVTKELPNTGGSESSALGLLGFAGVMGSLLLLKKQKED